MTNLRQVSRQGGLADAGMVVPDLAELVALRDLAQGRGRRPRGRHGLAGPAASALYGRGMEYAESREYAAGDDARHIDWKLTARSGRVHTKLFQTERARLSLIVTDTAAPLYFGTRRRFKSVQAARAGALGAWAAAGEGDRVAALRAGTREALVPPGSGARGVLRVLDALARWYARPPEDDAGLALALEHAQRLLRPGARLLVLADPGSLDAVPASRWSWLAARTRMAVLLLDDPLERDPPRRALPFAVDGRRVELDLAAEGVRRRWQQAFGARTEAALAMLRARRIRTCALSSAEAGDAWLPLFADGGRAG